MESQEARAERARFYSGYAGVSQQLGRPRTTIEWCERAIEEAEASGARDALAHGLYLLDWAHMSLGDQQAATNSHRALELFEELGDLRWKAVVLNNLGIRAYYAGEWDEATSCYDQARDVFEQIGDRWLASIARYNVAEILADQGRFDEAESQFRDVLRTWRAAGADRDAADAERELAEIAARQGEVDEALDMFARVREIYEREGEKAELLTIDARIAEVHLLAGRASAALEAAGSAIAAADGLPEAALVMPLLLRVVGEAHSSAGDIGAARASLERSLARAEDAGSTYDVALTLDAVARLDAAEGRDSGARERADELLARLGVRKAALPA
jgi:tetratricopeptide (TPR) repeat protein